MVEEEKGGGDTKKDDNLNFADEAMDPKWKEVQERLGIGRRQLFILAKSWKAVQRNLPDTGVEMFILYVGPVGVCVCVCVSVRACTRARV